SVSNYKNIKEMLEDRENGMSYQAIGDKYKQSKSLVYNIIKRNSIAYKVGEINKMTVEKRNTNADINTKVTDSDKKIIEGYGLLFNKPSHPLSSNGIRFIETISKEAVKDINFEDDIRLLLNHDSSQVLARTRAGNLK